jgi:hypothetical protein
MEGVPLTAAPVDATASEQSSSRVVQSTNFILASLVVSFGGMMWLFV